MRRALVTLLVLPVLVLAGCGGDDEPTPAPSSSAEASSGAPSPPSGASEADLKQAVQDFSTAFTGGDADAAYALLSGRCRTVLPRSEFDTMTQQATELDGDLDLSSIKARVDGARATVSYSYDVTDLTKADQPWVDEGGWKNDEC
jgi:hypothetical protein